MTVLRGVSQMNLQESPNPPISVSDSSANCAGSELLLRMRSRSSRTLSAILRKRLAQILRPPPARSPNEWADQCRVLPPGSAEPGPWNSSRTPYCLPIFAALKTYRRVVAVMGSQMGKTEGLFNVIGHKLDDDPAPVLYIGPTKSNIDGVIEPRISQMLKSAPRLWDKTEKGRRAHKLVKRVAGVSLRLAWAGSPTELASQPAH